MKGAIYLMSSEERAAYINAINNATPVTPEEIKNLQDKGRTFFVIKYQDKFFLTYDIENLEPYLSNNHNHMCTACRYCRALPTNSGGCDNVYDYEDSHITKYPFIRLGVEGYGCKEFLFVGFCKNFKPDLPRKNTGLILKPREQQQDKAFRNEIKSLLKIPPVQRYGCQ